MDEVAENSDALMERYLEGDEISHEETVTALKRGVTEGHLFPVTCGIATRNLGTDRLLEALVEDLPSPAMRGPGRCSNGDGETVEVAPDEDGELIAQAFKTTADPYTGRVNMLRVLSGTLRSDSHLHNLANGAKERVGSARRAARQGARAARRARRRRHRRGREAEGDDGRRPALRASQRKPRAPRSWSCRRR